MLTSKACVKRRAITSVESNPACASREMAEKAVNEVWASCFNDTRPFDEVNRFLASSVDGWLTEADLLRVSLHLPHLTRPHNHTAHLACTLHNGLVRQNGHHMSRC